MPNSVSAKKRLRQSIDRRDRNRSHRSAVRSQVRKLRATIAGGDRYREDLEVFRRLWPDGVARALAAVYTRSYRSNRVDSGPAGAA